MKDRLCPQNMKFIFTTLLIVTIIAFGFLVIGKEAIADAGFIAKDKVEELLGNILDAIKSSDLLPQKESFGGVLGGFSDRGCSFTETASSTVGASNQTQLLATSTRRAFARIQKDLSAIASSTVFVSFDGAPAGAFANLALNASSTATSIEFGLNTDLPYTGSVHAITNTGSTSVLVTECVYP